MKILIAPDKFKGSLSAEEVCNSIENGIKKFDNSIEVIKHPLADGGEGTLDILENYFDLKKITVTVQNPIFKTINAIYKVSKKTAFIEMANASGLQLLAKKDRNCCYTSTFGTGELILDAIKKGFKNIVLFIGGSATNDGGIGMASALGYSFYNFNDKLISPIGIELININKINSNNVLFNSKEINFTVVCDVKNPLYGKNGAAYMYAKQKGASKNEIEILDLGLQNYSKQLKKFLNKSIDKVEGAGAAGGLGAGALSFLNAELVSGIDFVFKQTKFEKNYIDKNIDLIISGEGSLDKQTLEGKVINGISDFSLKNNIPFSIIAGVAKNKELIQKKLKPVSINAILDLNITTEEAMQKASKYVSTIAYNLIKSIKKPS
jgi:glycerate kinase